MGRRGALGNFARGQANLLAMLSLMRDKSLPPVARAHPWAVPAPLRVTCAAPGLREILFGTDFSGMDMVAIQLKSLRRLPVRVKQLFASDSWGVARCFLSVDHGIAATQDVRRQPFPSVRVHLYVAGPPCQRVANEVASTMTKDVPTCTSKPSD